MERTPTRVAGVLKLVSEDWAENLGGIGTTFVSASDPRGRGVWDTPHSRQRLRRFERTQARRRAMATRSISHGPEALYGADCLNERLSVHGIGFRPVFLTNRKIGPVKIDDEVSAGAECTLQQ